MARCRGGLQWAAAAHRQAARQRERDIVKTLTFSVEPIFIKPGSTSIVIGDLKARTVEGVGLVVG